MEWPEWWARKEIAVPLMSLAEMPDETFVRSGIELLDIFLGGGILPGSIYEFVGQSGCGKTNLALAIAKGITLQQHKVYYFTTQKPLSVPRLQDMNLDSRFLITRNAGIIDDKFRFLMQELKSLLDSGEDIRLVVIDNIPEMLNDSYIEDNPDSIKLRILAMTRLSVLLKYLSNEFGFALLIINNVSSDMNGSMVPKLGLQWSNLVNHRIAMSKVDTTRTIRVLYSSTLESGDELDFVINNSGIEPIRHLSQGSAHSQ